MKWYLQESVLCLFLFDIFINDTGDKTKIKLNKSAEDMMLQQSKKLQIMENWGAISTRYISIEMVYCI